MIIAATIFHFQAYILSQKLVHLPPTNHLRVLRLPIISLFLSWLTLTLQMLVCSVIIIIYVVIVVDLYSCLRRSCLGLSFIFQCWYLAMN